MPFGALHAIDRAAQDLRRPASRASVAAASAFAIMLATGAAGGTALTSGARALDAEVRRAKRHRRARDAEARRPRRRAFVATFSRMRQRVGCAPRRAASRVVAPSRSPRQRRVRRGLARRTGAVDRACSRVTELLLLTLSRRSPVLVRVRDRAVRRPRTCRARRRVATGPNASAPATPRPRAVSMEHVANRRGMDIIEPFPAPRVSSRARVTLQATPCNWQVPARRRAGDCAVAAHT